MQWLIDYFFPPTIEEQKRRYIEKNGYPKESVIFYDYEAGSVGQLIGSEQFKRDIEKCEKFIEWTEKN